MKCANCKRKIILDMEGDLIHSIYWWRGVDPRMCEPTNPDSKIALKEVK
jgi:hypothetical protein